MKKLPKTKVCTRCGRRKKRTKQYFEINKRPVDGLSAQCRACRRAYYNRHFKKMYKDPAWREKKIATVNKAMVKYRQKDVNG